MERTPVQRQHLLHLFGKYEFNMVPFGLVQAPAYFQALISKVLKGLHKFAMAYLDDIIIFSKNEEEHLEHLRIIFQSAKSSRAQAQKIQMWFHEKAHPVPQSPDITRRNLATFREHASTQRYKGNQTIPRTSRVLP